MTKKTEITPEVAKILARAPKGFIERFEEFLPNYEHSYQAYEAVENEYESVIGHRRFSSWNSFRVVRERMLHGRRKGFDFAITLNPDKAA